MKIRSRIFKTRLGWMGAASCESGITDVVLPSKERAQVEDELQNPDEDNPLLDRLASEITTYLAGGRVTFEGYPIAPRNQTGFRVLVWDATKRIPYGKAMTYGQIAEAIGRPGSARAVGGALNSNHVPLIVPCHRVVASSGLGGFSRGQHLKRELLQLEGII